MRHPYYKTLLMLFSNEEYKHRMQNALHINEQKLLDKIVGIDDFNIDEAVILIGVLNMSPADIFLT